MVYIKVFYWIFAIKIVLINCIKKYIFKNEYTLCKRYEKQLSQKAAVLTVSENDAARMKELAFTEQAKALPIGTKIEDSILTFSHTLFYP